MTLEHLLRLLHPSLAGEVVLARAAQDLAGIAGLPRDAVVYVLAAPRARRALLREAREQGFLPTAAFVHVRDGNAGATLVQLDRRSLSYAATVLLPKPAWMRAVARVAPGPLLRVAASLFPHAGVACRRSDGAPLAAWSGEGLRGALVLRATRRDGRDRRFLTSVDRRVLVKLDPAEHERANLEQHAPVAARAGALVPQLVETGAAPRDALAITLLPGRPASTAISSGELTPDAAIGRVGEWLLRWNRATAVPALVTEHLLERELFAPLRVLEGGAPRGYRAWLEERSGEWLGAELPLVTAHLDLTMANVLVGPEGIGVVDWAEARADALPLVDLFYAAADAAAATNAYADRVGAFRDGKHDADTRLSSELGVSPAIRELCFHACWLQHARNEALAGSRETPFRRIVELVAAEATGG